MDSKQIIDNLRSEIKRLRDAENEIIMEIPPVDLMYSRRFKKPRKETTAKAMALHKLKAVRWKLEAELKRWVSP